MAEREGFEPSERVTVHTISNCNAPARICLHGYGVNKESYYVLIERFALRITLERTFAYYPFTAPAEPVSNYV